MERGALRAAGGHICTLGGISPPGASTPAAEAYHNPKANMPPTEGNPPLRYLRGQSPRPTDRTNFDRTSRNLAEEPTSWPRKRTKFESLDNVHFHHRQPQRQPVAYGATQTSEMGKHESQPKKQMAQAAKKGGGLFKARPVGFTPRGRLSPPSSKTYEPPQTQNPTAHPKQTTQREREAA